MKNIFNLILFSFLAMSIQAQDIISDHFGHLENRDNATNIEITGKMFSYATNFQDTGDEEMDQIAGFVSTVEGFRALAFEKLETSKEEYTRGLDALRGSFDELLVVRSPEGNFSLYVNETNGIVHELVGIGSDNEKFGVFSLLGHMDLKQIGKFAAEIQMEGFDKMEKIKDYNVSEVKVFPNPVSTSETFTLQTPDELDGADATLIDSNGRTIKDVYIDDNLINIKTNDLSPGIYYLNVSKESVSVKKKLIVVE